MFVKIRVEQIKVILGNFEKNLEKIIKLIDKGIEDKLELIVFPELVLNGSVLKEISVDTAMEEIPEILLEKSKKIDIIFGCIQMSKENYLYNTAFYLSGGDVSHSHRKVYLDSYSDLGGNYIKAGESIEVFDTKFGVCGMVLGDEICHQSVINILTQKGAKVIFNLNNSKCVLDYENITGKNEKLEMVARVNSMLNSIYTVVANRVGVEDGITFDGNSMVINPYGDIIRKGKFLEEDTIDIELDMKELKRARVENSILRTENSILTVKELEKAIKK